MADVFSFNSFSSLSQESFLFKLSSPSEGVSELLETIGGEQCSISGGWNRVPVQPLIRYGW